MSLLSELLCSVISIVFIFDRREPCEVSRNPARQSKGLGRAEQENGQSECVSALTSQQPSVKMPFQYDNLS